jgi:hypothetical protein
LVFVHAGGLVLLFVVLFFSFFIPLLISGTVSLLSDFSLEDFLESPGDFPFENLTVFLLLLIPFLLIGMNLSTGLYIFISGGVKGVYREELLQTGGHSGKPELGQPSPESGVTGLREEILQFNFSRFIQYGKIYFWRIVGLWALLSIIFLPWILLCVLFLGGITWSIESEGMGGPFLSLVLLGVFLFLTLILFTLYAYYSNVILVMENTKPGDALRGGIQFLKRHFGPAAGLYIILNLIVVLASSIFWAIQLPFSFIPLLGTLISFLLFPIQTLLSIYLNLYLTATQMVFYHDKSFHG